MTARYWWLSFVGKAGFLGGCIVEGVSLEEALQRSWDLGCNPGGEVSATDFEVGSAEASTILSKFRVGRVISKQELNEAGEFSERDRARMH